MTTRRPRIVLGAVVVLLTATLVLFAVALLRGHNNERRAAERRFHDAAGVSAALTESVFGSSAPTAAKQNSERFGTAIIDAAKLQAFARQSRLSYAVVLDSRGAPLAVTPGTTQAILARVRQRPAYLAEVLDGATYRLSGVLDSNQLEYAAAFDTPYGRRVMLQGLSAPLIGVFLGSVLGQLPDAKNERAYVLDSAGRVVASSASGADTGTRARPGGPGRVVASSAIAGSDWRIVLSQTSASLYRGIATTVQWLILVALALVGGGVVYLLLRANRATADLESASARLEEANADLKRSNLELTRSNGELEQFASVASHDLQEPLRKVQTFGDQIERRFGDEIPEEAKDYLRRMRRASARMSVLIEDLLRFSRVTTHARPPERVDLTRVARDVTQDLSALVEDTHGSVAIGTLPAVEADPTQMRQLLQNLIANALKFHRPGVEPAVTVDAAPPPGPGMVAFTISDDGIGFEEAYEERIFRVFERLHPRDVYAGTGIGLALCRKIAERHGGTVTGVGRLGAGATFTVTLPAASRVSARPAPVADPEPAHL